MTDDIKKRLEMPYHQRMAIHMCDAQMYLARFRLKVDVWTTTGRETGHWISAINAKQWGL